MYQHFKSIQFKYIKQMYHNNKLNQVSRIEKSLLTTSFSRKDSQTDHYLSSYTPTQQAITRYINRYQCYPWIKLSNEHIANAIGCTVRTVIRATNKLHKDGFITKHQENKYSSNSYNIILSEYVTPNLRSSLNINLFINLSPSSRRCEASVRVFKKTYPEKGNKMSSFQNRLASVIKSKPKRNSGGHSPAVLKPILPLEERIHSKTVDIAFFEKQLENPESFWDPHGMLFSVNITMAKSLLARAQFELSELKMESSNEKQIVSYQNSPYSMAPSSA
jgi:hypothetical protein